MDDSLHVTSRHFTSLHATPRRGGAITLQHVYDCGTTLLAQGLNHPIRAALSDPAWLESDACGRGEAMGVAVATPIYAPFLAAPANHLSGAELVEVPLARQPRGSGLWHYELDEAALTAALQRDSVRVLLWCNPHNPTGRVWTRDEMRTVAAACAAHDVALVSDEVWADLILDEAATPFTGAAAMLAEDEVGLGLAEAGLVVLTSPSKAFNIAALDLAVAMVPDPAWRRRFIRAGADKAEVPPFGFAAAEACYADDSGEVEAWRRRLVAYLKANRDHVRDGGKGAGMCASVLPRLVFVAAAGGGCTLLWYVHACLLSCCYRLLSSLTSCLLADVCCRGALDWYWYWYWYMHVLFSSDPTATGIFVCLTLLTMGYVLEGGGHPVD